MREGVDAAHTAQDASSFKPLVIATMGQSHSANSNTHTRLGGLWVVPAKVAVHAGHGATAVVHAMICGADGGNGQLRCQTASAGTVTGLASSD